MRGSNMEAPQIKLQLLGFLSSSEEEEEVEQLVVIDDYDSSMSYGGINRRRLLSKQLSMRETSREAKWEKRRRQILNRQLRQRMTARGVCEEENEIADVEEEEEEKGTTRGRVRSLTDEDLDELRGSIELGFGFDEENGGQNLCDTLPALDLYFAVNRQLSDPKLRSPLSPLETQSDSSSFSNLGGSSPSPRSPYDREQQNSNATDSWKICNPGDNPQHVKAKLRQWAQVVACSVRQCC